MNLTVAEGSIQAFKADTVVVNLLEGVTTPGGATGAIDQALDGAISELIRQGDLSGSMGECAVLYPRGAIPAKRVLVVGLGKAEAFDLDSVRAAAC